MPLSVSLEYDYDFIKQVEATISKVSGMPVRMEDTSKIFSEKSHIKNGQSFHSDKLEVIFTADVTASLCETYEIPYHKNYDAYLIFMYPNTEELSHADRVLFFVGVSASGEAAVFYKPRKKEAYLLDALLSEGTTEEVLSEKVENIIELEEEYIQFDKNTSYTSLPSELKDIIHERGRNKDIIEFIRQAKFICNGERVRINLSSVMGFLQACNIYWYIMQLPKESDFIITAQYARSDSFRKKKGKLVIFDLLLNLEAGVFHKNIHQAMKNFHTWKSFSEYSEVDQKLPDEVLPLNQSVSLIESSLLHNTIRNDDYNIKAPSSIILFDTWKLSNDGRYFYNGVELYKGVNNLREIILEVYPFNIDEETVHSKNEGRSFRYIWLGRHKAPFISLAGYSERYNLKMEESVFSEKLGSSDMLMTTIEGREVPIYFPSEITNSLIISAVYYHKKPPAPVPMTIDDMASFFEISSNRKEEVKEKKSKEYSVLKTPIPEGEQVKFWTNLFQGEFLLKEVPEDMNGAKIYALLSQEFPYFAAANLYIAQHVEMCARTKQPFGFKPILLNGAPGIGKTRWAKRISQLIGTGYSFHSLAGSQGSMGIAGSDRGWNQARPGFWAYAVERSRSGNPVVVMDELDKASSSSNNGSLLDSLLPFLEKETSSAYRDHFLMAEVDVSYFSYVFTSNDDIHLPEPLKSRIETFQCRPATMAEFKNILPAIVDNVRNELTIPDEIGLSEIDIQNVVSLYEAETSIRTAKKAIEKILRQKFFDDLNVEKYEPPTFKMGFTN